MARYRRRESIEADWDEVSYTDESGEEMTFRQTKDGREVIRQEEVSTHEEQVSEALDTVLTRLNQMTRNWRTVR